MQALKSIPPRLERQLQFNDAENAEYLQRMNLLIVHTGEIGPIFWGIKKIDVNGDRIPQTLKNKFSLLRDALSLAPTVTENPTLEAWYNEEKYTTEAEIEHLQSRTSGFFLPHDIEIQFRKTPKTALEAYRAPSIRDLVHDHLFLAGDPVITIIDEFTKFENLHSSDITERAVELGHSVLELFAFGAGGQPFVDTLSAANLQFHQDELQRRSISRSKKHT